MTLCLPDWQKSGREKRWTIWRRNGEEKGKGGRRRYKEVAHDLGG